MGRPSAVNENDISRAAVRLIGQGARPTVDAVYEAVGRRGSRTTIHKHLKAFLDDFTKKGLAVLPSSIPEPLVPIIEDFWGQALVKAGERYDIDREQWESQISELNKTVAARESVIAERDLLLDERARYIDQQQRKLEAQDREAVQLNRALSEQEAVTGDLKKDKERVVEQVQSDREQAQKRFDQATEDWTRERSQLERATEQARVQLVEGQTKMETLTDYWIMQVDDARQQVTEIKGRHSEDKGRWEGEMRIEKARTDRMAQTVSSLEKRVEGLEVELSESAATNSGLQESYGAALREVQLGRTQIGELEGEVATLTGALAELKIHSENTHGQPGQAGKT